MILVWSTNAEWLNYRITNNILLVKEAGIAQIKLIRVCTHLDIVQSVAIIILSGWILKSIGIIAHTKRINLQASPNQISIAIFIFGNASPNIIHFIF